MKRSVLLLFLSFWSFSVFCFGNSADEYRTIEFEDINICASGDANAIRKSQVSGLSQVTEFFGSIFSTQHWPARWKCGSWTEFHGWFYIISDLFIWLSYFAIPAILFFFLYKKQERVPFRNIFILFISFILLCGLTHLVDVLIFWWPAYQFSALVRFFTAIVSMGTVFALIRIVPRAMEYKSPEHLEQLVHERTVELSMLNKKLEEEIAQRKAAERKIVEFNAELEGIVKTRTAEMESFTYSVSHDLRSPLRSIVGYSQILVEDYAKKLDAEGKNVLYIIVKNANKMGRLIDDLLEFSRVGKTKIKKERIDTDKLVKNILAEQTALDSHSPPSLVVKKLEPSVADPNLLYLVWTNLISNALKYTQKKEERVIEINSYENENETVFFVKDNGEGFDMKYKHKLFKVFQRLHKMDEFEGVGVGLAIVHNIVTRHGGKVWVEAVPYKGATFYFSLPKQQHNGF